MKWGNVCARHPELEGERHSDGNCPECIKASKAAYRARNADKLRQYWIDYRGRNKEKVDALGYRWRAENKAYIREANLRRIGFTIAMFDEALALQDGECAICRTILASLPARQVHADHCHGTGVPRGVLCHHCNAGLGAFRDNPESLRRAISYLKNPTLTLI